jgi:hypothetical protein
MKDEIIIYQADQASIRIEVRIEDNTVWLSQAQIAELFLTTTQNITIHIKNIYQEKELQMDSTCKEYLQVQIEGKRKVKRTFIVYNLDMILSVGYRIKSFRATQFRIWATQILKEYLLKGQITNYRINTLENDMTFVKTKLQEIDIHLNTNLPPNHGIFFNGQVFDAYTFISEIIKKAQNEIILVDNYIDETVLTQLSKRDQNVSAIIYTSKISKQLQLDIDKYNSQYPHIQIKTISDCHDRFLIIDQKELYHIGASLKDLGKKWFAFSRMDFLTDSLLKMLEVK